MKQVNYIPIQSMEAITQKILSDYGYSMDINDIKPVPIEELVEFHFELDILWDRIDHFAKDSKVMGAIIPSKRQIVLNDSCKELFSEKIGALHFTLAHELGHWVLHHNLDLSNLHKNRTIEIQADLFAGCLLLPKPLITNMIKQYKWRGPIYLPHLYEIAERFQVSISALKVRLEQLNLLFIHKDGTVYHPQDLLHRQMTFDF